MWGFEPQSPRYECGVLVQPELRGRKLKWRADPSGESHVTPIQRSFRLSMTTSAFAGALFSMERFDLLVGKTPTDEFPAPFTGRTPTITQLGELEATPGLTPGLHHA